MSVIALTGIVILLLMATFFSQSVFISVNGTNRSASDNSIKMAFEYIGEKGPNWKSLVISCTAETDIHRDTLWKAWTKVEDWSKWQGMLVTSAKWTKDSVWKAGSEFEQTLDLGFPVGSKSTMEIVGEVKTKSYAAWWKNAGGVKTYHIWTFDPLPNGRSRVTNTVVFHGPLVGLTKIFYSSNWSDKFRRAVEGLIEYSSRKEIRK